MQLTRCLPHPVWMLEEKEMDKSVITNRSASAAAKNPSEPSKKGQKRSPKLNKIVIIFVLLYVLARSVNLRSCCAIERSIGRSRMINEHL